MSITARSLLIAPVVALALSAAQAQAQTRVFVAATGSDANPCTFGQPCRTFQKAHDTVAANGEIDVLDPAGYGAVTISKAISIQGHGYAGITTTAGIAITVNAQAGDRISLSGLLIDGAGSGATAVELSSGRSLTVKDCVLRGFTSTVLQFQPGNVAELVVANTLVSDNTASTTAIRVLTTDPVVSVTLDHVTVTGNPAAVAVRATNSSINTNPTGIDMTLVDCILSNNATGVNAFSGGSPAVVRLRRSTITGNGSGWTVTGAGQVLSYGDNTIDNNATNNGAPPAATSK
jgi:hypothetical protein